MLLNNDQLKEMLEEKVHFFNQPSFIANDPVSVPHLFTRKEDIEIAGYLTATLAWGQRVTIINKSRDLLARMDNSPYDFILNASGKNISSLDGYVHRTFQVDDCIFFVHALQEIFRNHGGLEAVFSEGYLKNKSVKESISHFRNAFFSSEHLHRTRKHLPDPMTGSAAKRINMYLRWLVRCDNNVVDFVNWKSIIPADIICPLDLHTGTVARRIRLLNRNQDDWQAVEELTANLRTFDPSDPVKYDFALFGTGVNEKFNK